MLVPSASASIAGSNIFSNVSSMSCLRRRASSNWDGGLSGGDGSAGDQGSVPVTIGEWWWVPAGSYHDITRVCASCGADGWVSVVSCYGGSESQIQKKLFSGPSSLSSAEPRPCLPPPLPPSEIQGKPGRGGSRGRGAPSCGESRHRDTLTHIVNVTLIVHVIVTLIVNVSQDTQPLVFIYQCY